MIKAASLFICLFITSIVSCQSATSQKNPPDHSAWDELLKKNVAKNGDVNYKSFKTDLKKLDVYLKMLSKVQASNLSKPEQQAYWINVYNAFTIDLVARNYPLKSIKDIRNAKSLVAKATGGSQVWIEKLRYSFDGEELSLYNIENKKLLKELFDPRIHFVINCASYSCPRLLNRAYTGNNLESLMSEMAREFINDRTKNKISGNKIEISEIFKWYKGDFTRNGTLIAYLAKYSSVKINPNASVSFINYDWSLNEM